MGFQRSFTAEGLNLERFLHMAGKAGIVLHSVRRQGGRCITALTDERTFDRLGELAERGGWKLTAGDRSGAGLLAERLMGRRIALGCALILFLMLWFASQVMWSIRIIGAETYEADVRAVLTDMGVSVPAFRRNVHPGRIRDALEWRYPEIAWFECGWRGMTLEIRAVQGISDVRMQADGGPCDVVAERDGIVSSIVTRAGTPVVKPGDMVREGQVLIRGEERTSGGNVRQVAARGSVLARVWDSAEARTPLYGLDTTYTGRTQRVSCVVCPWFSLWQTETSPYQAQDVSISMTPLGGFFFPLMLRTETRMEAELTMIPLDRETLLAENARAAQQNLWEITGGRESVVDNWVNWSIIEDEILLSVATGERIIDIARQERSSGMAATE